MSSPPPVPPPVPSPPGVPLHAPAHAVSGGPAPGSSAAAGSPSARGSTQSAGTKVDEGKGRVFPCGGCGADLVFNIGQQRLKCPYCGYEQEIEIDPSKVIAEQDFDSMLERLQEVREKKAAEARKRQAENPDAPEVDEENQLHEIRCGACGGTVEFVGSLTSSECPYCATPLQRENVHDALDRIPVDGVMPFQIDRDKAKINLGEWVRSRWFAPNEFRAKGVEGKFSGVYLPFWTFDSLTFTRYTGQRGEHYYVTVKDGDKERQERRTNWYPASGAFQRFFDDVLVQAVRGLNESLMRELEPWPLEKCVPFNQEMLSGYLARTYETTLPDGFTEARQRMESALEVDVKQRIGGDEQRITSLNATFNAVTFKHLLLPVWLLAYRYHEKVYQVMINAATGEVQGERPWSWVKITLATLLGIAAVVGLILLTRK